MLFITSRHLSKLPSRRWRSADPCHITLKLITHVGCCRYGGEHAAQELQKEAVYGLTEIYREKIRPARLVANPGCYPTSVQLPLYPLLKSKLIKTEDIIIDSKSGACWQLNTWQLGDGLWCGRHHSSRERRGPHLGATAQKSY